MHLSQNADKFLPRITLPNLIVMSLKVVVTAPFFCEQ